MPRTKRRSTFPRCLAAEFHRGKRPQPLHWHARHCAAVHSRHPSWNPVTIRASIAVLDARNPYIHALQTSRLEAITQALKLKQEMKGELQQPSVVHSIHRASKLANRVPRTCRGRPASAGQTLRKRPQALDKGCCCRDAVRACNRLCGFLGKRRRNFDCEPVSW